MGATQAVAELDKAAQVAVDLELEYPERALRWAARRAEGADSLTERVDYEAGVAGAYVDNTGLIADFVANKHRLDHRQRTAVHGAAASYNAFQQRVAKDNGWQRYRTAKQKLGQFSDEEREAVHEVAKQELSEHMQSPLDALEQACDSIVDAKTRSIGRLLLGKRGEEAFKPMTDDERWQLQNRSEAVRAALNYLSHMDGPKMQAYMRQLRESKYDSATTIHDIAAQIKAQFAGKDYAAEVQSYLETVIIPTLQTAANTQQQRAGHAHRQHASANTPRAEQQKSDIQQEIDALRAEGLSDDKIKTKLIKKYHPDRQDGGNTEKAQYVSNYFRKEQSHR